MVNIKNIIWVGDIAKMSPEDLFDDDTALTLVIEGPLYWWFSIDELFEEEVDELISKDTELKFCFDTWDSDEKICDFIRNAVNQALVENNSSVGDRKKVLQVLPMGTMLTSTVHASYRAIVYEVMDYLSGMYEDNSLPVSREWKDYFETLMDIKGVRELAENMYKEENEEDEQE